MKSDTFVKLEDLVALLHTSESTIRRDLDELEARGRLRRVHGGVESLSHLQIEESIEQKSVKNVQEKSRLAELACQLVEEGDVIFLDAGTTTEMLITGLVGRRINGCNEFYSPCHQIGGTKNPNHYHWWSGQAIYGCICWGSSCSTTTSIEF